MTDEKWKSYCLICGGFPEDGGLQIAAAQKGMKWVHDRCSEVFIAQQRAQGHQLVPLQVSSISAGEITDHIPEAAIEEYAKKTRCTRCGATGTLRGNLIRDEESGNSTQIVACSACSYSTSQPLGGRKRSLNATEN